MKLNVAIVEDSPKNIETLQYLLEKSPVDVNIIGWAVDIEGAKDILSDKSLDLAFLDIQLKESLIFELLEDIVSQKKIEFDIVFVTAHTRFEYATKAIQYACLDYITKPIGQDKLNEVLMKSVINKAKNETDFQVKYLLELLRGNLASPKSISINMPKGIIEVVQLAELNYIEADKNTSIFHLVQKQNLHSVKPLSYYLELLEHHPDFIQVSRNIMVNQTCIKRYDHRNKTIYLKDGEHIIVSHRYSRLFKEVLVEQPNHVSILNSILSFFKRK